MDGTDVFQERWDRYKEDNNMARATYRQVKAENLEHGDEIIDPEGNETRVIRIRRIDHLRGRLETEAGVATVPLSQLFPVVN